MNAPHTKGSEMGKTDYSDIYILPVGKYHIIHSSLRNISAVSDTLGIQYLYEILLEKSKDQKKLEAVKYQVSAISESMPQYPKEPENGIQPYFLGLIPTRSCNGNCIYCGFENKREDLQDMDYQTAITAIDWMADRMKALDSKSLEIHFFGGEPLVRQDIVSVAVHYARSIAHQQGLNPHFEVSTNGQVSDQTTRFVTEHFHSVVLSLDGKEEMHNRHRPLQNGRGSFARAFRFAEQISNSNAELCLRTCVSNENVEQLPEITQWFCETFLPSVINFENLKPGKDSIASGLKEPDPFKFVRFFNRSLNIAERYGIALINSSTSAEKSQYTSCPVGKDTVIVGPDANIHSCYLLPDRWREKGLDLSIGKISNNRLDINFEQIIKLRGLVKDKPRCTHCFCQWTCAGGCHVDVTYPGSDAAYDTYCWQTRMLGLTKILRTLGQEHLLEELLKDDESLFLFATRKSDRFQDWSEYGTA